MPPKSLWRLTTESPASFTSLAQSSLPPFPVGMPAAFVSMRTINGVGFTIKLFSSIPLYPAFTIACNVSPAFASLPVTVPSIICCTALIAMYFLLVFLITFQCLLF